MSNKKNKEPELTPDRYNALLLRMADFDKEASGIRKQMLDDLRNLLADHKLNMPAGFTNNAGLSYVEILSHGAIEIRIGTAHTRLSPAFLRDLTSKLGRQPAIRLDCRPGFILEFDAPKGP